MIYLILSAVSAFVGISAGLGSTTLLRPLLDAVSPLSPAGIAMFCTTATLAAGLVSAFFALGKPLPLHQEEIILLAAGAALGGIAGDFISARFMIMLADGSVVLLQNALLFTLIALSAVYFSLLSHTLRPLSLTRTCALPAAFLLGILASFLSFGAEPVTIALYYLLFDAENDEASLAALTVSLCAMGSKMLTLLIRQRFSLYDPISLLWLIPGALIGAFFAMVPILQRKNQRTGDALIKLSLFTSLINMAAALAG